MSPCWKHDLSDQSPKLVSHVIRLLLILFKEKDCCVVWWGSRIRGGRQGPQLKIATWIHDYWVLLVIERESTWVWCYLREFHVITCAFTLFFSLLLWTPPSASLSCFSYTLTYSITLDLYVFARLFHLRHIFHEIKMI